MHHCIFTVEDGNTSGIKDSDILNLSHMWEGVWGSVNDS